MVLGGKLVIMGTAFFSYSPWNIPLKLTLFALSQESKTVCCGLMTIEIKTQGLLDQKPWWNHWP